MARFDVYEYKSTSVPLVVEVQASLLADLNTCVVLPLVPEERVLPNIGTKRDIGIAGASPFSCIYVNFPLPNLMVF